MKFLISNYAYPGFISGLVSRGHEVLGMHGSIDSFNWWQHLINEKKSNQEYDKILRDQIEEYKPDIFLCGKGWHFEKFIASETIEWIKTKVKCTVYWSLDDPDFVPFFMKRKMYRGYDIALTCCGGSIRDYESAGLESHLFWPAWDQVRWEPTSVPEEKKIADFMIVGTPYTITEIPRRDVASAIAAAGLSLWIHGSDKWIIAKPDHFAAGYPSLGRYYHGPYRDWNTVPNLFAKARMNFSNHIRRGEMYLNDRVPIVLGTGAFLFVDNMPGLKSAFADGYEVVFFDNLEDLVAKAFFYVKRPKERERIAKAGQKKIFSMHTYEHRANQLLDILAARGLK